MGNKQEIVTCIAAWMLMGTELRIIVPQLVLMSITVRIWRVVQSLPEGNFKTREHKQAFFIDGIGALLTLVMLINMWKR